LDSEQLCGGQLVVDLCHYHSMRCEIFPVSLLIMMADGGIA
jgi:hypothetical protein